MTARRYAVLALLASTASLGAGCSSSGGSGGASSTPVAPPAPASTPVPSTTSVNCPPAGSGAAWPKDAPDGLPRPPGLKIVSVQHSPNVVIRFTVPDDFHATVRYLLAALPAAGFTLGTGDSEAEEADIPFSNGSDHASIKVNDLGQCVTGGLLALGSD